MAAQVFSRKHIIGLTWALAFGGLYLTSLYSRLFFHTLSEMFSIAVAAAIFMLVWNVRRSLDNNYLLFLGMAYLFVGCLEMAHTLAYTGVSVFKGSGTNLETQLWIAARYLESASLLVASFFMGRRLNLKLILGGYAGLTGFLLGAIFSWNLFPDCFVEGVGVTPFKRVSEFAIIFIFAAACARLLKKRDRFDPAVLRLLVIFVSFTVLSELSLSLFAGDSGFPYLLGHFFKIISLYFLYKAIIEKGLTRPLAVLFRNLKESENALREERDFIAGVLSTEDVMVIVLDRGGRIFRSNKACENLTGYFNEEISGKRLWELVVPEEAEKLKTAFSTSISSPAPWRHESSVAAKDGSHLWVLWSLTSLLDEEGMVGYIVASGIDITGRKKAEKELSRAYRELDTRVQERTKDLARTNEMLMLEILERKRIEKVLRESESKYRIVADNTFDWEWWRDPEGNFIYVSPSCQRITQHEAKEFMTDPDLLLRIIHPDDRAPFIKHQDEVEQEASSGEIEFRIVRPDGSLRWIAHACQPAIDGQGDLRGRRGSNRDITGRKRAEEALRDSERLLRHLTDQLLTAQETERRRISRELHDELGGALAVLKLRTSFVERNLPADELKLREECRRNLQHIDQIIDNTHRLSRDLSPSILEDFGLTPALRWLIDNFVRNYGLKVNSDIGDIGRAFPKNAQIMIYRILQEALSNIGKHAQAKNVSIKILTNDGKVVFSVEDDGEGFDVARAAAEGPHDKGLGLATMSERAKMLGGTFDLESEKAKGTRIIVHIPLAKGEIS